MLKKPLSFKDQVERLKEHSLVIRDEKQAEIILSEINYYRFTGYGLQFRLANSNSDFRDGTSFDDILSIYYFDEELRSILLKYLLKIELFYRTQISYSFSKRKCLTEPHDQHYNELNYYKKDTIKKIKESVQREIHYHEDSLVVRHHKNSYENKMPLWVIVELMSFSNLSKYYNCMYEGEQRSISSSVNINLKYLANWLHCATVIRNMCAHGNRLYNNSFKPPVKLPKGFLKKYTDLKNNTLAAYIYMIYKLLPLKTYKLNFKTDIINLINKYIDKVDFTLIGLNEKSIELNFLTQ